jgi:hypothetical protein
MNGIHEVTGSIPVWSTNSNSPAERRLRGLSASELHDHHPVAAGRRCKSVQITSRVTPSQTPQMPRPGTSPLPPRD